VDPHDNLISVVTGRKHIVLLDPSSAPSLSFAAPVTAVRKNGVVEFAAHDGGPLDATGHFSTLRFPVSAEAPVSVGAGGMRTSCGANSSLRWAAISLRAGESLYTPVTSVCMLLRTLD
jgi:hypothetical protein